MRPRVLVPLLALAAFASHAQAQTEAEGDPVRGKKLAIKYCAKCHVIGDHNPYGGINSTPSFFIFKRKPEVYDERILTFDQRRPHIALKLDVKLPQIKDIKAYVDTIEVH